MYDITHLKRLALSTHEHYLHSKQTVCGLVWSMHSQTTRCTNKTVNRISYAINKNVCSNANCLFTKMKISKGFFSRIIQFNE